MNAIELRQKRKHLGLSQEALAKALGVSWITISRWEREKNRIPQAIPMALRAIKATHRRHLRKIGRGDARSHEREDG